MNATIDLQSVARDFERDGCVRIRELLGTADLTTVRRELERYIAQVLPNIPEADRTLEADGRTVRNLWRMGNHDPFFRKLAERPEIIELVSELVHGEPVLLGVETFSKPAGVGSGVPPHQDNAYFCQSPPDALTVWIALDAATVENGPIVYVKGSHMQGVLPHRPSGVSGNSMGLISMPPGAKEHELVGTLDPGDALIHHCQTIHFSGPNKSSRARCGLLLVYRGKHTAYEPAMKEAYDRARATPS